MSWCKLDDNFADHPKVVRLQTMKGWEKAIALWTLGAAWSAKHLTEGYIPVGMVTRLGCARRAADMLVNVGLWESADNGYQFHNWLLFNPGKDKVEAKRAATAKRVAKFRNGVTSGASDEERSSAGNGPPVPTRPDPVPPGPPGGAGTSANEHAAVAACVTADVMRAVIASEAAARQLTPVPVIDAREVARAAARASELLRSAECTTAKSAAEALVRAAFDLYLGPLRRPLRFALAEATLGRPNGKARAQAEHEPPEDSWV